MNERAKSASSMILRFAVAALIIYLLTRGNKKLIMQTIHGADPRWFALALLCFTTSFLVCVARWHSLLKMQDIEISFRDSFVLAMQGMFFSLVIPGAVGGDIAKAGFISARSGTGSKTKAVFSILIDRIIGLLGLFVLAGALGIACFGQISTLANSARIVLVILVAGIILGLLGASLLFFHRTFEKVPPIKALLDLADKYGRGLPSRLMEALDGYRKSYAKLILWIMASAIFVHTLQGIAVFCLIEGTGETGQQPHYVVLASSLANAVGAIPLTPSGLGTRDVAISAMLTAAGMEKEKALSVAVMNTGLIIIFNLAGGIFFIASGRKGNMP